ncbi:MAG: hypothetical protein R3Y64_10890 [Peptostreptococcaceae bacterium]
MSLPISFYDYENIVLINVGFDIDSKITEITNITNKMLKESIFTETDM